MFLELNPIGFYDRHLKKYMIVYIDSRNRIYTHDKDKTPIRCSVCRTHLSYHSIAGGIYCTDSFLHEQQ